VSGVALPAVSATQRLYWAKMITDAQRSAAYSLVAIAQEIAILVGPLLFGAVLAGSSPAVALGTVATASGIGTATLAASLPAHGPRDAARRTAHAAALGAGMRVLLTVSILLGGSLGAIQVAVPATATAHGAPAASGLLLAILSIGGLLGGLIYGSRPWTIAPAARLEALLVSLTAALALLIPVSDLVFVGVLLFFAGVPVTSAYTTVSLLVDDHAPSRVVAEAFGWISLGTGAGLAPGNALAGILVESSGPHAGFALATIISAAATLVAGAGYGRLSSPSSHEP
jgi:hypothetical protein